MIITISGNPGSGKSTVAKLLAQKLGAERIYAGSLFRELARSKGITLEELNMLTKNNPEIDRDIDHQVAEKARQLAQQQEVVIVEGRTQFHFLPESIKVFITVDATVGAERIWNQLQNQQAKELRNEAKVTTLAEVEKSVELRDNADAERYQNYYGIDHRDQSQYDIVVDSTEISAEEVTERILAALPS